LQRVLLGIVECFEDEEGENLLLELKAGLLGFRQHLSHVCVSHDKKWDVLHKATFVLAENSVLKRIHQ